MSIDINKLPEDTKGVIDGFLAYTGPEQVVIDLTNKCNNNCIACWTSSPLLRDKTPGDYFKNLEFPFELLKETIDDLHRLGVKRIRFTGGGEPLMHPNILDLIESVKSLGMNCSLTTNFTLMDENAIEKLLLFELDEIAVSLWAGDSMTYSRVHPNKTEKTFHKIERLLLKLGNEKNSRFRLTIANVLLNMNYQNAIQMFDFAMQIKADAVYYTLIDPIPGYTDSLMLNSEQRSELLGMVDVIEKRLNGLSKNERIDLENFEQFKRRLSNPDAEKGHYDNNIIDSIPCYIGWMFCRLLPDGQVIPCCRGVNKPMGNLFDNSFEEIWNSKEYCEFRFNAKKLKKNHPYFHPIGCEMTCDNLMHNMDMHKRILNIFPEMEEELTNLE